MGSNFCLSSRIVQEGVMRRSALAVVEVISMGMSSVVAMIWIWQVEGLKW